MVMSRPSNSTRPDVRPRSPVRQLKKVDLPAPFGPIRPRMSPCSSVTLAASTALKLPKAFVTSRASRSMGGSRSEERRVGKECRFRWSAEHQEEKEERLAHRRQSPQQNS